MTDHKHDKKEDRHAVLDDWKRRIVDLMENGQDVPEVNWDAEPLRYYKLNKKWAARVFGWLDWLENEAGWKDAEGQDHIGIQGIMAFEEGIELPDYELDCGDVENCLSTSEIIASLNEQIDNLNQQIIDLQEEIEGLQNEEDAGEVILPPNPDMDTDADNLCRSAHYVANWLYSELLIAWDAAKTLTMTEFLDAILGTAFFDFGKAAGFWQFAQTIATPDLDVLAGAYIENIAAALFCAELGKEPSLALIEDDLSIPTQEKALWMAILDNYNQQQIDEKAMIGTLSGETVDCSDGCPWVVVYDFNNSYVADGSETLIIGGDTWSVSGGSFVAGVGYVAFADQMQIAHPLPQQCRLFHYYGTFAKGGIMLAADAFFWWRGVDGTGSEQWSSGIRVLSNDYGLSNFGVTGHPIMTQVKITFDAFFHSGSFGQKIGWVKLVGTGAYPHS